MSGNQTARFSVKMGSLEIEYEGAIAFLEKDLVNLMRNIIEFYADNTSAFPSDSPSPQEQLHSKEINLSTSTIAGNLNVANDSDLVIAAAAHLTLAKNKKTFTRKEILDEMKSASTYYRKNSSKNLSYSIKSLIKTKRLNQISNSEYSLSSSEIESLEKKLVE